MWRWLRVTFCRHADTLCLEGDHVFLRCDVCGRETAGWHVELTRK